MLLGHLHGHKALALGKAGDSGYSYSIADCFDHYVSYKQARDVTKERVRVWRRKTGARGGVTGLTREETWLAGRVTCPSHRLRVQLWSLGRLGRHGPADSVSPYVAGLLWT